MKLLRDFRVDFTRGGAPRKWTVFVGENGYCKTTILRAIALAASGRDRANQLAQNITPSLQDKRAGAGNCDFEAVFSFPDDSTWKSGRQYPGRAAAPFGISSKISASESLLQGRSSYCDANGAEVPTDHPSPGDDPLGAARAADYALWFVAAYGVGRSLPDPQTTTRRTYIPSLDRMRSLFEVTQIMATDFASRFAADITRAYAKELQSAFVRHHLLPDVSGVELRGQGGVVDASTLVESQRFAFRFRDGVELRLPAIWLSHGYQSTIAWVSDLIGQICMEAGELIPLEDIEGLVLIDEIDLHLHPTWQRDLVRLLKETFPRVQFVATTHSPMVLPGLEADEIFVLKQDEHGSVTAQQQSQDPALMTGGQLYRAFFDIDSLYPVEVGKLENDYVLLASNAFRSDEEEARLQQIILELRRYNHEAGFPPVPRQPR